MAITHAALALCILTGIAVLGFFGLCLERWMRYGGEVGTGSDSSAAVAQDVESGAEMTRTGE